MTDEKRAAAVAWVEKLETRLAALTEPEDVVAIMAETSAHMCALRARQPDLFFHAYEVRNRCWHDLLLKNWVGPGGKLVMDYRHAEDPRGPSWKREVT